MKGISDMPTFKIRQRVVCVKTHSLGIVKKGIIYTVSDITTCECGKSEIQLIGVYKLNFRTKCSDCQCIIGLGFWVWNKLFAPIKYDILPNSEIIKESIPEKSDSPIKEPAV